MVYTMVYIMVYMVYIMPVCSYLDMRPGAAPQKISLFSQKKHQNHATFQFFAIFGLFIKKVGAETYLEFEIC